MSITAKTTVKQESATARFYAEMKILRKKLPKNWQAEFFQKFPMYDNHKGATLVNNVYYLRSTYVNVMEGIKQIIDHKGGQNV